MKLQQTLGIVALVALGLAPLAPAQTGPVLAPRPQTRSFPATANAAPGQPAPVVECLATCGTLLPVSGVAFSPDGKILAVGGYQEVVLWDLTKATFLKRLGVGQLGDQVRTLAFTPDGRFLVAAEGTPHGPGSVKMFDVAGGQLAGPLPGPKDVVYTLAFSPDGKTLAAGGAEGVVHVWNPAERKSLTVLKTTGSPILSLAFSPNGKFLAAGGADKNLQVWEVPTWKPSTTMQQTEAIQGVAFSPDSELLALAVSGPDEKMIRIRRRDNAQEVRAIDIAPALPLDLLWTPKNNRFFVPCSDKTVKVFQGGTWNPLATLSGHGDWVYRVAVNTDGSRVASASADGTVKLYSGTDGKLLATFLQLTPRTDEWLLVTPQGYLATSTPTALRWKTTNVKTSPEKITALFLRPELVRDAIIGNKIAPPPVLP